MSYEKYNNFYINHKATTNLGSFNSNSKHPTTQQRQFPPILRPKVYLTTLLRQQFDAKPYLLLYKIIKTTEFPSPTPPDIIEKFVLHIEVFKRWF